MKLKYTVLLCKDVNGKTIIKLCIHSNLQLVKMILLGQKFKGAKSFSQVYQNRLASMIVKKYFWILQLRRDT